jgi:hypothetical protein
MMERGIVSEEYLCIIAESVEEQSFGVEINEGKMEI